MIIRASLSEVPISTKEIASSQSLFKVSKLKIISFCILNVHASKCFFCSRRCCYKIKCIWFCKKWNEQQNGSCERCTFKISSVGSLFVWNGSATKSRKLNHDSRLKRLVIQSSPKSIWNYGKNQRAEGLILIQLWLKLNMHWYCREWPRNGIKHAIQQSWEHSE